MRCAILHAPGDVRIEDVDDPVAGPGDVILKTRAALTCGTDLKAFRRGHPKMPFPTPFGHEFTGEIVEVGAGVERFKVGDPVMSANTGPCLSCFYCDRGQENLCTTIMDEMILGAFAEYVRVPKRVVDSNVFHKPDELTFDIAALMEPLASVCFGATLPTPELLRDDATAIIIGAGPIALFWLIALRDAGVGRIVVAGRRAPRLAVARSMGADATFGEGDDLTAEIEPLTNGRGADIVVECTGLPEVWEQAMALTRRGGMAVLFGGCKAGTTVELDTYRFHYDGVRVASPFHFRPRDVAEARRLLTEADADWSRFITSTAALDDVPEVFARLSDGVDIKCAVLPNERS